MRIVLCGKNAAAVACLEFLASKGDDVWAIGTKGDDGQDSWQPSFRGAAARLGAEFAQPRRINDDAFVDRLAAWAPDRLVSIQDDQILRGNLFAGIGAPCLNLHFSLLPRHRGVAPIAWAILSGDAEAGVTLHHMVKAIDAGDLVAQRALPIEADDTARSLYDKLTGAAVDLFQSTYPFSPKSLARRLPQDASLASYHKAGDIDFGQTRVTWSRPAVELQRWLRAFIFPPLQHPETHLAGEPLQITLVGPRIGPAVDQPPGTIVARTDGAIEVAARGGTVTITGMRRQAAPSQE